MVMLLYRRSRISRCCQRQLLRGVCDCDNGRNTEGGLDAVVHWNCGMVQHGSNKQHSNLVGFPVCFYLKLDYSNS